MRKLYNKPEIIVASFRSEEATAYSVSGVASKSVLETIHANRTEGSSSSNVIKF